MRILRVVGSSLLPCGCFVGLYETYGGPTVQIVEERGVECGDRRHQPGMQLGDEPRKTPLSPPMARPAA